jgi:diaminopimelate epimerase
MRSQLVKVEGAGNDFLLGTGTWAQRLCDDTALVIQLCDRRRGVGADGALAVFVEGMSAIRLVHRNADGSPSAFCANGTRCAARAAVVLLGCDAELVVTTGWAEIPALVGHEIVTLELPAPEEPSELTLNTETGSWCGRRLVVGVPHFVVPVTDLDAPAIAAAGPALRSHRDLGGTGANIHFVQALGDGALGIRSFERGVQAEVLCCGSGVVAAALLHLAQTKARTISVVPGSGDSLEVATLGPAPMAPSRLTGPARLVAEIDPFEDRA